MPARTLKRFLLGLLAVEPVAVRDVVDGKPTVPDATIEAAPLAFPPARLASPSQSSTCPLSPAYSSTSPRHGWGACP